MNCKSLLAIAAVAATGASLAVESSTTLCRIKVESGTRETIIGLPLVNVGATEQVVNVTNFVLTTGLPDQTKLSYKSDTTWYNWLNDKGTWVAAMGDSPAELDTFERGAAVLVSKPTASNEPIYLYGQINTAAKTFTPLAKGDSTQPVYTLMGNARASDFDINTTEFWTAESSPSDGDLIIVPIQVTVTGYTGQSTRSYKWFAPDNKWKCSSRVSRTTTWAEPEGANAIIPAGQGFWYVSNGSAVPTVAW